MWRTLLRGRVGRFLLRWVFSNMSWVLPVERLRETETLIAFRHPAPSYPVHILIVPKRAVADLEALSEGDAEFFSRFLCEVVESAQILAAELRLKETGYRLIVNNGGYQDIPQLHFHLISG